MLDSVWDSATSTLGSLALCETAVDSCAQDVFQPGELTRRVRNAALDVVVDLGAAVWNLSCGFYKSSAANLRSALDIAVMTLYFQVRQNTHSAEKGWDRFFTEWDRGERDTPNWGETKPVLKATASVKTFNAAGSGDIVDELHAHFRYLSAYTHGRAFTTDGRGVRVLETYASHAPAFDAKQFQHISTLTIETIGWISTIWQVVFPQIIDTQPLGPLSDMTLYRTLFSPLARGRQAIAHRLEGV
jgi:hypothetical protein